MLTRRAAKLRQISNFCSYLSPVRKNALQNYEFLLIWQREFSKFICYICITVTIKII